MYTCNRCNASFSRKDSLVRHTKRVNPCSSYSSDVFSGEDVPKYREKDDVSVHSPEMDDDDASVLSFGTTDRAINSTKRKDLVEDAEDAIRPYKRSKIIPEDIKPPDNRSEVWGSDHWVIT